MSGNLALSTCTPDMPRCVGQLKIKAKQFWEAVFFYRGFHNIQLVDRDDFQAWFDPMQQHGQCASRIRGWSSMT
jgi:hypothetical protein